MVGIDSLAIQSFGSSSGWMARRHRAVRCLVGASMSTAPTRIGVGLAHSCGAWRSRSNRGFITARHSAQAEPLTRASRSARRLRPTASGSSSADPWPLSNILGARRRWSLGRRCDRLGVRLHVGDFDLVVAQHDAARCWPDGASTTWPTREGDFLPGRPRSDAAGWNRPETDLHADWGF